MKSQLRSEIYEDGVLEIDNPIPFSEILIEERKEHDFNGIKGVLTSITLNGVQIDFKDVTIEKDFYSVAVEHDFSFIKLHFEIEGDNEYCPDNKKEKRIYIPQGHYNFFYLPIIKGNLNFRTQKRKTVEISFTTDYLEQLFHSNLKEAIPLLAEAIEKKTAFLMWDKSRAISPQLQKIITEITECSYSGVIKKAFLESKVVEIISYLFTIINENENKEESTELSSYDYSKIIELEMILKNRFKENHSLSSLAADIGLNTFKLKKYFKQIYGVSVFAYLTSIRMEYAKKLIVEKGFPIAIVSEEVGYKNPQHFTVAFKKTFGYLPSKLKK